MILTPEQQRQINAIAGYNGFDAAAALMGNDSLVAALRLAQTALNTAPRFKIPTLPREHNDSYKVAAIVDKALRELGE